MEKNALQMYTIRPKFKKVVLIFNALSFLGPAIAPNFVFHCHTVHFMIRKGKKYH